jgi:hypothetical protein
LLAAEISIEMTLKARESGGTNLAPFIGAAFFVIALIFVYRSFYKMRIKE